MLLVVESGRAEPKRHQPQRAIDPRFFRQQIRLWKQVTRLTVNVSEFKSPAQRRRQIVGRTIRDRRRHQLARDPDRLVGRTRLRPRVPEAQSHSQAQCP